MSETTKPCAIIPVYRHGKTLLGVVESVMARGLPAIVVDDGNDGDTKGYIAAMKAAIPSCEVVTLPKNRGKGGAVIAGLLRARELGFTHAFQIDADGQHDPAPMAEFLELSRERPSALVCGYPVYDDSVPASRKVGRKITNAWVAIETLSGTITDAMCGFRLYPVESACRVCKRGRVGLRMTFDIDILVRLSWAGVPIVFRPIKVVYPEGGVSNFRMVKDNVAISCAHTRLFFGMLVRLPVILARRVAKRGR